jgi:hypothetical protein
MREAQTGHGAEIIRKHTPLRAPFHWPVRRRNLFLRYLEQADRWEEMLLFCESLQLSIIPMYYFCVSHYVANCEITWVTEKEGPGQRWCEAGCCWIPCWLVDALLWIWSSHSRKTVRSLWDLLQRHKSQPWGWVIAWYCTAKTRKALITFLRFHNHDFIIPQATLLVHQNPCTGVWDFNVKMWNDTSIWCLL